MNNEKKYREIAKFCMKQKADENIAKEYEEHGMKDAMRASRICNRLRWILDPYSKTLVRMIFDVREDEGSNKEAKETVLKYINEGYKARLAFIGDYNYAMESYGVVLTFQKDNEEINPDNSMVFVVPYGKLLQFCETLNQWFTK